MDMEIDEIPSFEIENSETAVLPDVTNIAVASSNFLPIEIVLAPSPKGAKYSGISSSSVGSKTENKYLIPRWDKANQESSILISPTEIIDIIMHPNKADEIIKENHVRNHHKQSAICIYCKILWQN